MIAEPDGSPRNPWPYVAPVIAETSYTQTITTAVEDINTHIKCVVDLLARYEVRDSEGLPVYLQIDDGFELAAGSDLGELVEVALRTAIARQIEPRP